MKWYVMHEGKTAGPVDGEEIFKLGKQGQLFPSMHVRDEAGGWMPILQSPFASVVSMAAPVVQPQAVPGGIAGSAKRIVIGVVGSIVVLVGGLTLIGALSKPKMPPVPVAQPAPEPEPAPHVPTPLERLASATSLRQAIPIAKPLMGDTQNGDVSQGAVVLALWWAHHPNLWAELLSMPDTKRAEIMKDPDPYRGQRICITGSVIEIARDKSTPASAPVFEGGISHNSGYVRFLAVGSTTGIVESTPARFCGIAIGLQTYPNRMNSTTTAVYVVGEFDIPANGGQGLPQYDEW